MKWYLIRRVTWTLVAVWLILSGAFFLYAYTPDPNIPLIKFAAGTGASAENTTAAQRQAVQAYATARNYNVPVIERYHKWMINYVTLDWGRSFMYNAPVTAVLARKLPYTLVYLLPGLVLSLSGGVAVGLYSATHHHGLFDRVSTTVSYIGFGIPSFFLGELLLALAISEFGWLGVYYDTRYGLFTLNNLDAFVLPTLVVTANMLAVQVRYTRAETIQYVTTPFVKRLRANGASPRHVARHVLRNAAVPLVSLFFTEMLTVLFVTIYVIEVVFKIPGLGQLAYEAILNRDIGIILATTLLPVFVGLFGNLLQDIAYTVLDPRIEANDQ
jgi:peptide/nickel transport system permease protein